MNIEKRQIDELDIQLTLNITNDDYASIEKKKLNAKRQNAEIKGFRKGKAPMSLIQKFYGEQALLEAINEVISDSLNNYIKDNNLKLVGEPLSSEDQPEFQLVPGNDYVFKFDLGLLPEITVTADKGDNLPYYNIEVSKEAITEMKANMLRQLGSLQDGETAKEDDFVIVDFVQEGKTVEGAYVSLKAVEGDSHSKFLGSKIGDKFDVNVNESFTNEADRASMLKITKEELADLNPLFNVEIKQVKTFVPATESQEVYDKLFGEGKVKTTEDFEKAISERLVETYKQEADFRLAKDMKQFFVEKAKINLPESFLKRWLHHINEGKFTMEAIEKDFPAFAVDYRWQLIRSKFVEDFKVKVEEEDIYEAARGFAAYQYAMYGIQNAPEQMINDFAQRLLSDERQARQIIENVEDTKVVEALKEVVTLKEEKISVEKFRELK